MTTTVLRARAVVCPLAVTLALSACSDGLVRPPPTGDLSSSDEIKDFAITFDKVDLTLPPQSDLSIPCETLRCKQVSCGEGFTTTVTGKVTIPTGQVPLYNAIVYIPNRPDEVLPFKSGVVCDTCSAVASGKPLVVALTDENGKFVLENAPAGDDIPIIIQLGRWRRQFIIPTVTPCDVTVLPDKMLKMPSKKTQGDIPKMALATGSADPFECLLRKIGIDDTEFTDGTGNGRVHIYKSNGADMAVPVQDYKVLVDDLKKMKGYDVIMLPCEGLPIQRTQQQLQNLVDYTSAGGRVFGTHYSYKWFNDPLTPFHLTGEWKPDQGASPDPFHGLIDQTFPKGRAFAKWLKNTGASTVLGQLDIKEPRHDIDSAYKPPSQRWLYGDDQRNNTAKVMLHMTFNTPLQFSPPDFAGVSMDGPVPDGGWGPVQCGRVVYSDFHVSADALGGGGATFPTRCKIADLSAQEKALTFMLFDLSACVTPDEEPPEVPIP